MQVTRPRRKPPATPRQAASCCRPIDRHLDLSLFRALGDGTRLRLLSCLLKCGRPCSVGELAGCCAVDLSVVSRHLRVLERSAVLVAQRRGRTVWFAVRTAALARALRALATELEACATAGSAPAPGGRS